MRTPAGLRVITDDPAAVPNRNPLCFDGAARYFWVDGAIDEGLSEYHWLALCMWLMTSVARGGELVVSEAPPPNAGERLPFGKSPDTGSVRWLCRICATFDPRPEPIAFPPDCCTRCGGPEMHQGPMVGIFNDGCWMAEPETGWGTIEMLHCRCDGYSAPQNAA